MAAPNLDLIKTWIFNSAWAKEAPQYGNDKLKWYAARAATLMAQSNQEYQRQVAEYQRVQQPAPAPTRGQYYGFDTPEQAQQWAALTPEQQQQVVAGQNANPARDALLAIKEVMDKYGVDPATAVSYMRDPSLIKGAPESPTGLPSDIKAKPGYDWATLEEQIRANKAREEEARRQREQEAGIATGKVNGTDTLDSVKYAESIMSQPINTALYEQRRRGFAPGPNPGETVGQYMSRTVGDEAPAKKGGGVVVGGAPHWIVDANWMPVAAITEDGKDEAVMGHGNVEVVPLDPQRHEMYMDRKKKGKTKTKTRLVTGGTVRSTNALSKRTVSLGDGVRARMTGVADRRINNGRTKNGNVANPGESKITPTGSSTDKDAATVLPAPGQERKAIRGPLSTPMPRTPVARGPVMFPRQVVGSPVPIWRQVGPPPMLHEPVVPLGTPVSIPVTGPAPVEEPSQPMSAAQLIARYLGTPLIGSLAQRLALKNPELAQRMHGRPISAQMLQIMFGGDQAGNYREAAPRLMAYGGTLAVPYRPRLVGSGGDRTIDNRVGGARFGFDYGARWNQGSANIPGNPGVSVLQPWKYAPRTLLQLGDFGRQQLLSQVMAAGIPGSEFADRAAYAEPGAAQSYRTFS